MQQDFNDLENQMVEDINASSTPMENLAALCDQIGSRFAGTSSERKAASLIARKFKSYGLKNVHQERFEFTGWKRGKASPYRGARAGCRVTMVLPVIGPDPTRG